MILVARNFVSFVEKNYTNVSVRDNFLRGDSDLKQNLRT